MTEPTVAGPRRPISHETYTGAELETRSARPGAYDALALPSRMGDRQVVPSGSRVSLPSAKKPKPVPLQHRVAPPPPPAPPPAVAKALATEAYKPRAGSVSYRVLEVLRTEGGHLSFTDIGERLGVSSKNIAHQLEFAFAHGALVRHDVGGRPFVSLPGYVMPERPAPTYFLTTGSVDAINMDNQDRRWWPIEQPAERPPTPKTDAAADLQRALDSAQALAEIFVQLERQVLVVAALMGDAIARLSPPPASPFPTAA